MVAKHSQKLLLFHTKSTGRYDPNPGLQLIDFDRRIDITQEDESGHKTDSPRQYPERHDHDHGVSEIDYGGQELSNAQL